MQDKQEILQNYEKSAKKERNLSVVQLLYVYLVMAAVFLFVLPTIYIRNEIYYISRDINELRTKKDVLEEENRGLKNSLEALKFKHQILDAMNLKERTEATR